MPESGVEYICISHAHKDHIGRVSEVPTGIVLASPDVCMIAEQFGVPHTRLRPVTPGEKVGNISILPGYSMVDQPVYTFFYFLFRRRGPWRHPAFLSHSGGSGSFAYWRCSRSPPAGSSGHFVPAMAHVTRWVRKLQIYSNPNCKAI